LKRMAILLFKLQGNIRDYASINELIFQKNSVLY